MLINKNVQTQL